MKTFVVYYKSRYFPFEGTYSKKVIAPSKRWIRDNWHAIIHTDEYRIVKSVEAKEN